MLSPALVGSQDKEGEILRRFAPQNDTPKRGRVRAEQSVSGESRIICALYVAAEAATP
jgi:hypothetical protein